ncbi:hypothetical protein [Alkalithermobacter paradoxus]|uniref:Uncharacterized protein n=1 Tax=Alkalithermobacter paradoxus TaxID=29349 RepID=A0A1V4I9B2_9FIRM|nr:hypothetical protein CLOTH_08790 [[Clostridium] thermoalcaliphilum]
MKNKEYIIRELERDIEYLSKVINKMQRRAGAKSKKAIAELRYRKEQVKKKLIEIRDAHDDLIEEDPIEEIKESLKDIWKNLKKSFDKFMDEL